jgi:ankyrin repeat protein
MHHGIKLLIFFIFSNTTLIAMDMPSLGQQLRYAAKANDELQVLALIAAGAPVNLKPSMDMYDSMDFKLSALQWAAKNGNRVCVRALIAAGASLATERVPRGTCVRIDERNYRHRVTNYVQSALGYAAEHGHTECVQELIAAKANIDYVADRDAYPAIALAVTRGHSGCVRELIAAKANPNYCRDGRTLLMLAAGFGHAACAEELIAAGVRLNFRDPEGRSVFDWAARSEHHKICNLFADVLLRVPNQRQRTSIIILFALMKRKAADMRQRELYRNRDSFFRAFLRASVYAQNKNIIADMVAGEVTELGKQDQPDRPKKSQTKCSIQ